ncbi:TlpA family protein disulfide reductase [Flavobacteriaceae bacterium 144Ye]|nr:TlpA family protein disulfide reductase [Flavobacteriaceae bacterium 144Ye]
MKYTLLILTIILCFSCKEEKKDAIAEAQIETPNTLELEVHDFNGIKKYLTATDDKTYVVNFWATWCAPCVKELPYFETLNSEYKTKDVEVILISLDFPSKYESKLKPFIVDKKLQSKVVALDDADANSWIPKVDESWSGAIPATVIFNKNKRKFYEKSFTYDELETELKQFLN